MKKKVLLVVTKANWGGAQRYVYDLATHLAGYEVAVAHGAPGRLTDLLAKAGIPTHPIAALQRDVSLTADLKGLWELYRLFKKERPAVVHLNSSKAAGLGALAARLSGVPRIVFTAHGWPFWERRNPLALALIWLMSWVTALFAHRVICISDYDLRVARAMPGVWGKAVRIYNGIAPIELGDGAAVRGAFPPGARITGTVGELTRNKNQQALIEEARRRKDMHVAIVGEGELRHELEQLIKKYRLEERVKLFGFMPAADVLKGFDVFALPSLKEGLPYVLIEAKMAGLPIVANRVGGVGEVLDGRLEDFTLDRMVKETAAQY